MLSILGYVLTGGGVLVALFTDDIAKYWPYALGAIVAGVLIVIADRMVPSRED